MSIKGYKVFNPDWTCRGFQYKVGETFTHNGNIEMCGRGFHFCRKASDCFNYYEFNSKNKVAEIEALGDVETQGDKSVTDAIRIVREIEWMELLTIVNEGNDCTGLRNSGDRNSGDWNSGSCNSGDWNSGSYNSGSWNSGSYNSGSYNSGSWNSGSWNSGSWNSGDWNSGSCNSGDRNSGSCNSGDRNSGSWNSSDYSTGFLNSEQQPIYMFNQPTNMQRDDICNLAGIQILNWNYENSWWIYSSNMTDEEKKAHPEHETTGGYLKTVGFITACKIMWDNLDNEDKEAVRNLPNFDKDVFKKITGICVEGENEQNK